MSFLKKQDPFIYENIQKELIREEEGLEMIASENYTSPAILEAAGSVLTNKYSEGYPGKRYYGGNEFIDLIEAESISRAKNLFGAEHANVQPHSGSQANFAAYLAILSPGDKILSLNLSHGGHLTHGHNINFSGKFYKIISYGVSKETGRIDMDEVRKIALAEKPKLIIAGASAYPREWDFPAFAKIAQEINAYFIVDMAHIAGLVAAKIHSDPVPFADIVTSTTHKTLRGPRSGFILCKKEDRLANFYKLETKDSLATRIDKAVFPGTQGGPLEHIIAGKAVCFGLASKSDFIEYQKQVVLNAQVLANILLDNDFKLISGGTDNHLILIDVTSEGLTGKIAEKTLEEVGIYVNKNMIPFDSRSPMDPSGIRLGTPALTTRGFKEKEIEIVGNLIVKALKNHESTEIKTEVAKKIKELTAQFPLYKELE